MPVTAWNPNFPALAVVLADQLKRVGINVKVRQLEAGVYIDDTAAHDARTNTAKFYIV